MKTRSIVLLRKKRVASGAVRYDEDVKDGELPVINSIYIQDWADPLRRKLKSQ